MSTLVEHARREMELIGEDPDLIEGLCKVVQAYADMNHSGGSHMVVLPMLMELLDFRNLSPLTNDPDEWEYHDQTIWGSEGGIWQNVRNSEAFSADGGKNFWLLGEHAQGEEKIMHVSTQMKPKSVVSES